jgi:predicted O-methyltransferase YrrM
MIGLINSFLGTTNKLLRKFNYELRPLRSKLFDSKSSAGNFATHFEKTEGMINYEAAQALYELAKGITDGCIVEVGSYRGRSGVALGRGSIDGHNVPVYAFDPHEAFEGILGGNFGPPDRAAFYKAMLDTNCYQSVRLVNLSSEVVAPNWNRPISLLWIDGDHTYEGVKRDYDCWSPHLKPNAIVAFDDSIIPDIGPFKLIEELIASNQLEKVKLVGKVTILKRK